jgi:hypothetical protein
MKKCKGKERKAKQAIALSEIFIIVCATIAFAFILGSSLEVVSAREITSKTDMGNVVSGDYALVKGVKYTYDKGNDLWIADNKVTLTSNNIQASLPEKAPAGTTTQTTSAVKPAPVVPAAKGAVKPPVTNTPAKADVWSAVSNVGTGASKLLTNPTTFDLTKADGTKAGHYENVVRYESNPDGSLNLIKKDGSSAGSITDAKEKSDFIAKFGSLGAASPGVSTVTAFYSDTSSTPVVGSSTTFKNIIDSKGTFRENVLIDSKGDVWTMGSDNKYTRSEGLTIADIKANRDLVNAIPADTNVDVIKKIWGDGTASRATIDGKAYEGTLYRSPTDATKAIFVDSKGNQKKLEASLKDGKEVWKDVSASKEDLTKIAGKTAGGHLTEALVWAGGWAAITQIIGATGIIEKNTANALTVAGVGGIFVWKGLVAWDAAKEKGPTWMSKYGGLIGLGVAAVIFWLMYKKSERRIVELQCLPFEPPVGGKNCEKCNNNPFQPCSEYRCKSLGQACQLLNPGTGKELCAWESKFDVKSATIQPLKSVLSPSDLKYIEDTSLRPNAKGVKIVRNNGCLQAFTPLVFGITTNEPTQCKIDYSHTSSYADMQYLFGGENYYSYNHTQKMKLPTPEGSANDTETPELKNDGTYSLYVRCQDINGNQNVDEYSVSFCVEASEDTTPPLVIKSSIISGSSVRYMVDSVPIEIYVNEPSNCRWSRTDKPYEDMENGMNCASSVEQINNDLLYTCSGNLTGVKDKEDNKFFFRCKDNPGKEENKRNVMVQSWPSTSGFILKGSRPLIITNVAPNGTLFGSTTTVNVNLNVETSSGAEEGKAICMFSPSGINGTYLNMYETENYISKQSLDLTSGNYRYYFRCNDAGGNTAENSTAFRVEVDKSPPLITRVYKEIPDALKIITSEDAECAYSLTSCNFEFNDGIKMIYSNPSIKNVHFAEWKPSSVYYLRCKDFYNNEPSSGSCNLIVSAVKLTSERVDA